MKSDDVGDGDDGFWSGGWMNVHLGSRMAGSTFVPGKNDQSEQNHEIHAGPSSQTMFYNLPVSKYRVDEGPLCPGA